jgi:16S rRNA (adenine1518-N6/adenine1519-N6)-dimethyltransferase
MVKTKFGQHFLIDKSVIEKEISVAHLSKNDIVLEIGPGKGILTQQLAQKCNQVIAVELDDRLIPFLRKTLPENVILIHNDIMELDWNEIPNFTKVVANLPFQISSPFTFKLFQTSYEKAVLIYQKEFAQRMIADPGSKHYSRLSVGVSYKAHCRIICHISPSSFSPHPEVYSSLVELVPLKSAPFHVVDESYFFTITNLLFSHRRKQIKTIVKHSFSKTIAEDILFASNRVEELSPEKIALISNQLYPYKSQFHQ